MAGTETALTNLGDAIYTDLVAAQHRYGRVATGKTLNAIEVHVEGNTRMYITGPAYLVALEKGRNPTHATGPFPRYGGLTFKDSLRLWMQAKGIEEGKIPKNGGYGPVLWAIYVSINKLGYAGSPGVLSKPISNDNINKLMDQNLGPLANIFASQVLNDIFN